MRFFASWLPIPRRKTQRRLVRAMVCLLALALLVANTASAAMPMVAASGSAHATAPAANHCEGEADRAPAQAPHGEGCPCCDGTSCACAHVCGDVTVLAALGASSAVSTHVSTVLPSRDYATVSAPLLRPPIA